MSCITKKDTEENNQNKISDIKTYQSMSATGIFVITNTFFEEFG